jgi:2-oxoglutarate decarboxylase
VETQDTFGANEWLVEEMYERYRQDPDSVDKAWWAVFAEREANPSNGGNGMVKTAATKPAPAPAEAAPARPAAAAPAVAQPAVAKPASAAASAVSTEHVEPAAGTPKPAARTPEAPKAPANPQPKSVQTTAKPPAEATSARPTPADPLRTPDTIKPVSESGPAQKILRGAAARTATNMDLSLSMPTATSVRAVPVKALADNRIVINNHLRRSRGGKVSFTHIIGYAMVKALQSVPEMNNGFTETDGKPTLVTPPHVNLGLAIDMAKPDGTRTLLVPSIKECDTYDFAGFWMAYEQLVRKARDNKLTVEDFAGTTISLTNPGTIGTNHSVPRLMPGQGTIIGVGAIEYPAEYQGTSEDRLNEMGISKILTLTSTYDHRIIQGAQSGEFLRRLHQLLLGENGFYDEIFTSLRIPYEPIRWAVDLPTTHDDEIGKQARVVELIHAYRVRGHLMADTDPLEYKVRTHPDLDVITHGLTLWDLEREFATGNFGGGKALLKLRQILGILRDAYCRTVGIEYMHIQDPEQRRWIQKRVEQPQDRLPREEQLRILAKLNQAEAFETFLQTKFVGQRRFSLEGGESTIAVLDEICDLAAMQGMDEVTLGMAHRGRLNALANIVGKSNAQIFREFEGNIDPRTVQGSGDVKYHLGAEGEFVGQHGDRIKVSMAANPSHLEAVDPVLEGIARAKQDILNKGAAYPVLPVLVHGDAAFAGQGVVAETLNLSQLRGYRTGGTIHIVVNNQVGFTTSPASSRSSIYSTDVARMVQAPIFHVNGDDPEACIRVARLAYEFRHDFNKDVVIDLVCYRRRGHNEGDDPSFTQPLMYDLIEAKRSIRKLYTEALVGRGDITITEAEQALRDYNARLERVFAEVRAAKSAPSDPYFRAPDYPEKPEGKTVTAVTPEVLKRIADAHVTYPQGFTVHPKVAPQLERRANSITAGGIDWGTGEILAFGSLLMDGRPVRLAGQDSRRGTFVQRFATIVDRKTGAEYTPLSHLSDEQANFHVYDSLLSEYAAMGFEYGYSVARPDALVLWEAQFGDFTNGAQIIVDEFISSAEAKWGQRSGVVLLLPHGYEGLGPDHSSARIERFLQLAVGDAMAAAQPSTPASYFHLLRAQALGERHRPLIVFTPKSMLRSKAAVSSPEEFTSGAFQPVIPDSAVDAAKVDSVVLCSGKIAWELRAERAKRQKENPTTAIVTVELLAPTPVEAIKAAIGEFPNATRIRWVQDEPVNQGAWPYMFSQLGKTITGLDVVSRPASAAPAVGSNSVSQGEHAALMDEAFAS